MPRLTAEMIAESPQFMNAVKDWELDLRDTVCSFSVSNMLLGSLLSGNKLNIIENLGATLDQFDTIDFSDNEIRKLEGFPLLLRLKTVMLSNNKICRIADDLDSCLPLLETLVLTNNCIEDLSDLNPLSSIGTLTYLCLLRNPVIHKPGYRHHVIHLCPQLRVLDFKRIKQKERDEVAKLFAGKKKEAPKKNKVFNPNDKLRLPPPKPTGPSAAEIARIRDAIASANSLEEVQRLETLLRSGQLPGAATNRTEEEEMEN